MSTRTRSLFTRLDRIIGRVDQEMLTFYGSAQVAPVGTQPARSADRLEGLGGDFEIRHDSAGNTYLAPVTSRSTR